MSWPYYVIHCVWKWQFTVPKGLDNFFLVVRETDRPELRKASTMRTILAALPFSLLAACSTHSSPIPPTEAAEAKRAVVVELFSSEGCSSCPPADLVVRDLARLGNHGAAELITIEQQGKKTIFGAASIPWN